MWNGGADTQMGWWAEESRDQTDLYVGRKTYYNSGGTDFLMYVRTDGDTG